MSDTMEIACPTWRIWLRQVVARAFPRTVIAATRISPARIETMAITTSSSIRVKAALGRRTFAVIAFAFYPKGGDRSNH